VRNPLKSIQIKPNSNKQNGATNQFFTFFVTKDTLIQPTLTNKLFGYHNGLLETADNFHEILMRNNT